MKKTVALFFGGVSGEHDVSRISAASIYRNLDLNRYTVLPIGITPAGQWFLQEAYSEADIQAAGGSLKIDQRAERRLAVLPGSGILWGDKPLAVDVAFLITHGTNGEDGRLQGLLDLIGVPYTGAGVLGSALGMDKAMVKEVWAQHKIPVVPFTTIRHFQLKKDPQAARCFYDEAVKAWGLPLFVKPANSGSSVGVGRATDFASFEAALTTALAVDTKVLLEPAVNAREIEVAVLGTAEPTAFVPGEIVPSHEFYDYEAKYTDPNGAQLLVPARLEPDQTARIQALAVEAYKACDCAGLARVDFFLDRTTGQLYLNEINTLPGFTTISMFPRMCMAAGLTYPGILDRIIEDALTRA